MAVSSGETKRAMQEKKAGTGNVSLLGVSNNLCLLREGLALSYKIKNVRRWQVKEAGNINSKFHGL